MLANYISCSTVELFSQHVIIWLQCKTPSSILDQAPGFLKLSVSECRYACLCVCPLKPINNKQHNAMWHGSHMISQTSPPQSHMAAAIGTASRRGLKTNVHCRNQPNKSKPLMQNLLLSPHQPFKTATYKQQGGALQPPGWPWCTWADAYRRIEKKPWSGL